MLSMPKMCVPAERYVVVFKWRLKMIEILSSIGCDWPLDMRHTPIRLKLGKKITDTKS